MPPRRRRLPARRASTGNFGRTWKKDLVNTSDDLNRLRQKNRNAKIPNAIRGSVAVLAGAAAAGALQGYGYPTIMGIDTDIALGVGAIALGASMARPTAILFGAGCLTKAVGEWSEAKAAEMAIAA